MLGVFNDTFAGPLGVTLAAGVPWEANKYKYQGGLSDSK